MICLLFLASETLTPTPLRDSDANPEPRTLSNVEKLTNKNSKNRNFVIKCFLLDDVFVYI